MKKRKKNSKKYKNENGELIIPSKPIRNYLHFEHQANYNGTGYHSSKKYSRKQKHKKRYDEY